MNAPQPIETEYGGYRFRSRLEARWAVFFTEAKIPFQYEAEGYDLGDLGWYLPDFWLPDPIGMFVECKAADIAPRMFPGEAWSVAFITMARNGPIPPEVLADILRSSPEPREQALARALCKTKEQPVAVVYGDPAEALQTSASLVFLPTGVVASWQHSRRLALDDGTLDKAMRTARHARFEHDERKGRPPSYREHRPPSQALLDSLAALEARKE